MITNRTKIEWTDYTWNPITGCNNGCPYCYARNMATRLRGRFGYPRENPFQVTFHKDRLSEPLEVKKPAKIFTYSMGEMFDPETKSGWVKQVFHVMELTPRHTYQVLTKCPENLPHSGYPDNVWVGVSIDYAHRLRGLEYLRQTDAKVKFVSFEPLLERVTPDLTGIDWVIVGAMTGRKPFQPPREWVETITKLAQKRGIAVFHKPNLKYAWLHEFPHALR